MNEEIYKQNILDHYKDPHHKGILDPCNMRANAANKNCGDELTLYLNIKDRKITEVAFDGDGCAISIAGASMLADTLEGMSLVDACALTEDDIFALFGVPIGPARAKCALLAYSALQEALSINNEDTNKSKMPTIIKEVGFEFHWSEQKVWALQVPVESIDITELEWHFDIPFWNTPHGYYDLKPRDVVQFPKEHQEEYKRTMDADLSYPLDIMENKGRWLLLDGLHRLVKAKLLGRTEVAVRKISRDKIPDIAPEKK